MDIIVKHVRVSSNNKNQIQNFHTQIFPPIHKEPYNAVSNPLNHPYDKTSSKKKIHSY